MRNGKLQLLKISPPSHYRLPTHGVKPPLWPRGLSPEALPTVTAKVPWADMRHRGLHFPSSSSSETQCKAGRGKLSPGLTRPLIVPNAGVSAASRAGRHDNEH